MADWRDGGGPDGGGDEERDDAPTGDDPDADPDDGDAPAADDSAAAPDDAPRARDDAALLLAAASGDVRAGALLYARHRRAMFREALHLLSDDAEAEDVVQEAFVKAIARAAEYLSTRPTARAWLLRIVRNLALDRLDARKSRPAGAEEAPEEALESVTDAPLAAALESADDLLLRKSLHEAIGRLPTDQREVVRMECAGMTREEIAARTGESPGTVASRRRLALQKLIAWLRGPEAEGAGA